MTERQMAVLHLEPGHVVGAVAVGGRVPTVADATGGSHVSVRIADQDLVVRVPAALLTARPVAFDADVVARPTHYLVSDAAPPVAWAGAPTSFTAKPAKIGREALSIWDGGPQPEIARESLDDTGDLPSAPAPPGQTRRLIAVDGEPLMYEP